MIQVISNNTLEFKGKVYRCALGKGGVKTDKREGDGTTPTGTFALRSILYRADRINAPQTLLPLTALKETDGWCDDPEHPDYNRPVTLPFQASHEKLWRDDHIYDIIVVLGHNDDPPEPYLGSAVFFHLAREGYKPTEGCVALTLKDMLEVLEGVSFEEEMTIFLQDADQK